jgi:hypothetical protein
LCLLNISTIEKTINPPKIAIKMPITTKNIIYGQPFGNTYILYLSGKNIQIKLKIIGPKASKKSKANTVKLGTKIKKVMLEAAA